MKSFRKLKITGSPFFLICAMGDSYPASIAQILSLEVLKKMAKIYLQRLSAFIEKATLPERGQLTLECKHFFSGAALYVNSRICLSLTPLGFALKLPKKTREYLLEHKKAIPLRYFDQGPVKNEYVLFPENVERAEDALFPYVAESIRFVCTLTQAQKRE